MRGLRPGSPVWLGAVHCSVVLAVQGHGQSRGQMETMTGVGQARHEKPCKDGYGSGALEVIFSTAPFSGYSMVNPIVNHPQSIKKN